MTLAEQVAAEINRTRYQGQQSADQLSDETLAVCTVPERVFLRGYLYEDATTEQ